MKILYLPDQYSQQRQHEKKRWIWPVHLAMEATYYKLKGDFVFWDRNDMTAWDVDKVITEPEGLPFANLPHPDRIFTKADHPKYQRNGNFLHLPGTYIQSAAGCWWGACSFCKEKGKPYELRPVDDVIAEIKECKRLGYREIFDDAASFATGAWREEFCVKLRSLDITFSCNLRFHSWPDFVRLKKSGFRMLLYGLESANQETLDRINKGVELDLAIDELERASKVGLENHIAVMFGYPWETDEDAIRTLRLVHYLLRKGYAKTAQASFYEPRDIVPLSVSNLRHKKYVHQIYRAAFYPDFWLNRLKEIRNTDDIRYIWRGIKSCFGK